jgi:hypothetical protein
VQPLAPPPLPAAAGLAAVQRFASNAFALPPGFQLRPSALGQRLPEAVQQKMEAVFGTNFADVRVHVGGEAASIGALAFTIGSDLYFAPGQYNPQTPHGQRLLGHELTHVVQQSAGRVRNPLGSGLAVVQDPDLEAEAERMGMRAVITSAPIQSKLAGNRPTVVSSVAASPHAKRLASNGAILPSISAPSSAAQRRPGPIVPPAAAIQTKPPVVGPLPASRVPGPSPAPNGPVMPARRAVQPKAPAPISPFGAGRGTVLQMQMKIGFEFQCRKLKVLKYPEYDKLSDEEKSHVVAILTRGTTDENYTKYLYKPDKGPNGALVQKPKWYLTSDGGEPEFVIEPPIEDHDSGKLAAILEEIKNWVTTNKSFGREGFRLKRDQNVDVWIVGLDPAITADPQLTAGIRSDRISGVFKRLGRPSEYPNVQSSMIMTENTVAHYQGDAAMLEQLRKQKKRQLLKGKTSLGGLMEMFGFNGPEAKQAFGILLLMASYVRKAPQLERAYQKDFPLLSKSNFVTILENSPFKPSQKTYNVGQINFICEFICSLSKTVDDYIYKPEPNEKPEDVPTIRGWVVSLFSQHGAKDLLSWMHNRQYADNSMGNLDRVDRPALGKTGPPAPILEFRRMRHTIPIEHWPAFAEAARQWIVAINAEDTKAKKADFPTLSLGAPDLLTVGIAPEKPKARIYEGQPFRKVFNLDAANKQAWKKDDYLFTSQNEKMYIVARDFDPLSGSKVQVLSVEIGAETSKAETVGPSEKGKGPIKLDQTPHTNKTPTKAKLPTELKLPSEAKLPSDQGPEAASGLTTLGPSSNPTKKGTASKSTGEYQPNDIQQTFLNTHRLNLIWIKPDGKCVFGSFAHLTKKATHGVIQIVKNHLEAMINKTKHETRNDKAIEVALEAYSLQAALNCVKKNDWAAAVGDVIPVITSLILNCPVLILMQDGNLVPTIEGQPGPVLVRVTSPLEHYHVAEVTK